MQQINHWPDVAEMTLPESVAQDLHRQLLDPFNNEGESKEFWEETYSTVVILDPNDTISDLHRDSLWNQIEFALTYPEYTLPLKTGYTLLVAIVNDSGAGIYLVVPPELSRIIPEE